MDAVRGGNVLISKDEAKALDPFLQRADEALACRGWLGDARERATAAFEVLWHGLKPRLGPGDAFELGSRRDGTMIIGDFTRSTDSKTYLVAEWRDIDDASSVLYFERTAQGLKLHTNQFDN